MERKADHFPDAELLAQLKLGASPAFEAVYRQFFKMTAGQVSQFGRADFLPEDIFQESLIVLVRLINKPDFVLTSKLSTLLFGISRNVMLQKAGRKSEVLVEDAKMMRLGTDENEPDPEAVAEREAILVAIEQNMGNIAEDCRDLLQFSFFDKMPQVEIAAKMGYSEAFVKVKKFRCLEYLRKKVKASLGID